MEIDYAQELLKNGNDACAEEVYDSAAVQQCEETIVQKLAPYTARAKIKHDWYQTELFVSVTILIKNVRQDEIKVESTSDTIYCKIQRGNLDDYELSIKLAHAVDPNYCKWKITPSKIEIQLKKTSVQQWTTLHASATSNSVKHFTRENPNKRSNTKDWDKIVIDMTKDDIEEAGGGNDLFQKLYSEGSDEIKKAMNKSFMESGGTSLSTNWDSVSKTKYEVKAPDGMEWRKWDT